MCSRRRSMLLAVLLLPARYSLLPYATRFSLFGSLILAIVLFSEADRSLLITCYILLFISTRCSGLTFSADYCTLQANYCLARFEFLASLQSLLLPSCRQVVGANAHFLLPRACYSPLIPRFLLHIATSSMFAVLYP